jgi:hypothetical protein
MGLREASLGLACIATLSYNGCRPDPRVEEARLRELDSVRKIAHQDSLLEVNINNSLREPLRLIDERRLDSLGTDCFRLMALFAWGVSPAGPVLAIRGCHESSNYTFTIHTFPPGKDPTDMSQHRRKSEEKIVTKDEFLRINNALDSIDFESIPEYINVDYSVMDASQYYIERYKNGHYHAIVRVSAVDSFVFKLFAEATEIADMNTEIVNDFRRREGESEISLE